MRHTRTIFGMAASCVLALSCLLAFSSGTLEAAEVAQLAKAPAGHPGTTRLTAAQVARPVPVPANSSTAASRLTVAQVTQPKLPTDHPATAKDAVRTCTKCHDESEEKPVLSILKSKHAVMADPRTPFADNACMSCHGPSEAHLAPTVGGKRGKTDVDFSRNSKTPAAVRDQACLGCHEKSVRMHWKGSRHESENVACTSCHTLHNQSDPVLAAATQTDVCVACHKGRRADLLRPSNHPMREGEMSCSGCHNSHGSTGPKLLVKDTVNETCFTCHAEKRGPFLWEHAPVREDCSNCHKPHGSVNASLLKSRTPWLCQQCHMASRHPSTAYSGTGLPGPTRPSGAQQLLGKNCMNCHSEVHGTNHPSGARKTR